MKYKLLFLMMFSAVAFSQNPLLMEHEWRLTKLNVNGNDYPPPSNSEVEYVPLHFNVDGPSIDTQVCNFAVGSVTYDGTNAFAISSIAITLMECTQVENTHFEQLYFWNFFNSSDTYTYSIEQEENALSLVVTAPNGNQAFYTSPSLQTAESLRSMITIYPNPADAYLGISGLESINFDLQIFDQLGRLQHSETGSPDQVDIRHFQSGVYFAKISAGSQNMIFKFIKR